MDDRWKETIWQQFGGSIDMLENAMRACPESLSGDRTQHPEFWYTVYHTLFFLDFYLSETDQGFMPPEPFTLSELDPAGVMPERVFTKKELLDYLQHGRGKCQAAIRALTEETAYQPWKGEWMKLPFIELLLYNMRHVQHHAAQLNLMLRRAVDSAPTWVRKTKVGLNDIIESQA